MIFGPFYNWNMAAWMSNVTLKGRVDPFLALKTSFVIFWIRLLNIKLA